VLLISTVCPTLHLLNLSSEFDVNDKKCSLREGLVDIKVFQGHFRNIKSIRSQNIKDLHFNIFMPPP
jgi:hypothetical protein